MKFYFYFFYRLRSWFKAMADDGLHDWKALLVVSFLLGAIVYSTANLSGELTDRFLLGPGSLLGPAPLAIGLGLLNYFLLLHKPRWRRYENEFNGHTTTQRRIGAIVVALAICGVAALFIVSVVMITPAESST